MRPPSHRLALLFAACLATVGEPLRAQDPVEPAIDPGTSAPATGGTAPPAAPATSTPAAPASTFGSDTNPSSAPAGTAPTSGTPGGTPGATAPTDTGAPVPGTGTSAGGASNAPTFTAPGGYGQGQQTYTAGEGRLARPRFQYSITLAPGYDDNVFSTPYNAQDRPAVIQRVETSPATPAQTVLVQVSTNPNRFQYFRLPAQKATFQDILVARKVPAAKPVSSFGLRTNLAGEIQFSSRQTVFLMDLRGSATNYTNKAADAQYNGSVALTYIHRITPRLQFSATTNLAYLSQPDLTRVNAPTGGSGSYFNGDAKFDLTYHFTPRLATVTSLSVSSQIFENQASQMGNFYEAIIGTEARWSYNRRLVLIGEARFGEEVYPMNSSLDSHTIFALAGAEFALSRRLTGSVRAGLELRTYENAGTADSPYFEASLNYQLSRISVLSLSGRFGFESPNNANSTNEVFRSGLNYVRAFSPRLRATTGFNYVSRSISNNDGGSGTDYSENSFELDLGLAYTISRHSVLTGNYTFLTDLSSLPQSDYRRNQLFLGYQYAF